MSEMDYGLGPDGDSKIEDPAHDEKLNKYYASRLAGMNPNTAALNAGLADKTGKSYEQYRGDPQHAETAARVLEESRISKTMKDYPELQRWAVQDSKGADMSADDLDSLMKTSDLVRWFKNTGNAIYYGWKSGRRTSEQGYIWNDATRAGQEKLSDSALKRSKEIDDKLEKYERLYGENWLYNAANVASTGIYGTQEEFKRGSAQVGAAAGAITGMAAQLGAAGAVAGGAAGVSLAPVVAGAATVGGLYAANRGSAQIEAGLSRKEMEDAGVDAKTAMKVSQVVGEINGALEIAGDVASLVPVAKPFVNMGKTAVINAVKDGVRKLAARDAAKLSGMLSYRGLTWDFFKGVGQGMLSESITEGAQELTTALGTEYGKHGNFKNLDTNELANRVWDTVKSTAEAMAILGPIHMAPGTLVQARRIRAAKKNKEFLEALADIKAGSKLAQRAPNHFGDFVASADAGDDGNPRTLYVAANDFNAAMKQAGVSLDQINSAVGEDLAQQVRDAQGNPNVDIEIPLKDYAAYISGSDFDKALQPKIRADENRSGLTYEEALNYQADIQKAMNNAIQQGQEDLAAWEAENPGAVEGMALQQDSEDKKGEETKPEAQKEGEAPKEEAAKGAEAGQAAKSETQTTETAKEAGQAAGENAEGVKPQASAGAKAEGVKAEQKTAQKAAQPQGERPKAITRQLTQQEKELRYIRTQIQRQIMAAVKGTGSMSDRVKNVRNQMLQAFMQARIIEQLARRTGMTPMQFWRSRYAPRVAGKNLKTNEATAPLLFDTPIDVQGGVDAMRALSEMLQRPPVEGEPEAVTAVRRVLASTPEEVRPFITKFLGTFTDKMADINSAEYAGVLNLLQAAWRGLPAALKTQIELALPKEVRDALDEQRQSYRGTHGAVAVYAPEDEAEASRTQEEPPASGELEQRNVSTRVPTATKATEDPYNETLLADYETLKKSPKNIETAVKKLSKSGNKTTSLKSNAATDEQKLEDYINEMKNNLLWLYDLMPQNLRGTAKLWYDGGRKIAESWGKRYGLPPKAVAAAIAVLSPQKDWFQNLSAAERVMDCIFGHADDKWDAKMSDAAMGVNGASGTVTADEPGAKWVAESLLGRPFDKQKDLVTRTKMVAKKDAKGKFVKDENTKKVVREPVEYSIPSPNLFHEVEQKGVTLRSLLEKGDYETAALWIRSFDQGHNDRRYHTISPNGDIYDLNVRTASGQADAVVAWGSYNEIGKCVSVIMNPTTANISVQFGAAHKVRNFFNNLDDPASTLFATIDTHAVAASLLLPLSTNSIEVTDNFGGLGNMVSGISGLYPVYFEAYRRAAAAKGILPREMQSITWEMVRLLFPAKLKKNMSAAAKKKLEDAGQTVPQSLTDEIRGMWEAWDGTEPGAQVIRNDIKELVKNKGAVLTPSWSVPAGTPITDGTYDRSNVHLDPGLAQGATQELHFEVAPDPANKALSARWSKLPFTVRTDITRRVLGKVLPQVLDDFEAHGTWSLSAGGFLGVTSPSVTLNISTPTIAKAVARMLGYVLGQDSVAAMEDHARDGFDKNGAIVLQLPASASVKDIDALGKELYAITVKGRDGHAEHPFAGFSLNANGEMVILNFSSKSDKELLAILDDKYGGKYSPSSRPVYATWVEKADYNLEGDRRANHLRDEAASALEAELGAAERRNLPGGQDAGGSDSSNPGAGVGAQRRAPAGSSNSASQAGQGQGVANGANSKNASGNAAGAGANQGDPLASPSSAVRLGSAVFGVLRADRSLSLQDNTQRQKRCAAVYRAERPVGQASVRSNGSGRGGDAGGLSEVDQGGPEGAGGGLRLLKPILVWKPGSRVANACRGWALSRKKNDATAAPEFEEFAPTVDAAKEFFNSITAAKSSLGWPGACVEVKSIAELTSRDDHGNPICRIFLSKDRQSGFVLKNGDDLVSVFSSKNVNSGDALVECAIAAGARRLDCYGTILPKFYAAHGFRPVARLKFDVHYAPSDWDYKEFAKRGYGSSIKPEQAAQDAAEQAADLAGNIDTYGFDGAPDIIFMVLDPERQDQLDKKREIGDDGMPALPATNGMAYGWPETEAALTAYQGAYQSLNDTVLAATQDAAAASGANLNQKPVLTPEQQKLDDDYEAAVKAGDEPAAQQLLIDKAKRLGFNMPLPLDTPTCRVRTKNIPTKTIKAYKAFYVDPATGQPSALFASGSSPIPTGVWVDAKEMWHFVGANGRKYIPVEGNEHGKGKKKGGGSWVPAPTDKASLDYLVAKGFMTQAKADKALQGKKVTVYGLAYRPGWHAGMNPFFPQGGTALVDASGDPYTINGYKNAHEYNKVVYEIEVNADHDLTKEAEKRAGHSKSGNLLRKEACFDKIGKGGVDDGFYYYTTNQVAAREVKDFDGAWVIADSIRIVRALSEDEVNSILDSKKVPRQPWVEKPVETKGDKKPTPVVGHLHLEDLNVTPGPVSDAARKVLAPTYDKDGKLIPLSQRFDKDNPDVLYQDDSVKPIPKVVRGLTPAPDSTLVKVSRAQKGAAPNFEKMQDFTDWAVSFLQKEGDVRITSTGHLAWFAGKGIRASTKRSRGSAHRDAYLALREMIQNAEYSGYEPPDKKAKHREGQAVYHSALQIGDTLYAVRLKLDIVGDDVKEHGVKQDVKYKDHKLTEIEIAPSLYQTLPGKSGIHLQELGATKVSLGILRGNFKPSKFGNGIVQQDRPGVSQGPNGSFNTATNTITLTDNANLSTFAHETGHWYLETIMSLVKDGYGDGSLKGDVKILCDAFGIQSAEEFFQMAPGKKRVVHERFAAWVEEYLATGKAPDESLKGLFQRFSDWIIGVYKEVFLHNALSRRHERLFGEKLPVLSDEVRGVLDRMLGAQRQSEQVQKIMGAVKMFAERPEWVSEEEWQAYADAIDAQTQEGREVLQKRSVATMKWAKRAKSKMLRDMQRDADAERESIRQRVMERMIAPGTPHGMALMLKSQPTGFKIRRESLSIDNDLAAKLRQAGIIDEPGSGLDASEVLQNLGTTDLDKLIEAALEIQDGTFEEDVENEVDLEMQADHPEFATPEAMEKAADEAIAPQVADRVAAAELSMLRKLQASTAQGNDLAKRTAANMAPKSLDALLKDFKDACAELEVAAANGDAKGVAEARGKRDLAAARIREQDRQQKAAAAQQARGAAAEARDAASRSAAAVKAAAEGARADAKEAAQQKEAAQRLAAARSSVEIGIAQEAANRIAAATRVRALSAARYIRMARTASQRAMDALAANNIDEAVKQKQLQLVYSMLSRIALDAQKDAQKLERLGTRINGSDKSIAKRRMMPLVQAVRAILSQAGVLSDKVGERASTYLKQVQEYDPADAALIADVAQWAQDIDENYRDMTYQEFQEFKAQVNALWDLSRQLMVMDRDGKQEELNDIRGKLRTQLEARFDGARKTVPHASAGKSGAMKNAALRLFAGLRRVNEWCRDMDGGEPGPFTHYIYQPMKKALDAYREATTSTGARLTKIFETYNNTEASKFKGPIESTLVAYDPETGKSDRIAFKFNNKAELLGALLHTGNASNKQKLIGGYGWGQRIESSEGVVSFDTKPFDDFIADCVGKGILTKDDFDLVQGLWDVMESLKPAAQAAHKRITGRYFDEVTNTPFSIKFPDGTKVDYRGGYAPAKVDPLLVDDHTADADKALAGVNMSFSFPTTGLGFTKSRKAYYKPLLLDIQLVNNHVGEVLKAAYIEPTAREIYSLVAGYDGMKGDIQAYGLNGRIVDDMLIPWLSRAVSQTITAMDPNGVMRAIAPAVSWLKARTGLLAMCGNIGNALEEISGFSVAASRIPAKFLTSAFIRFNTGRLKAGDVMAKSSFMKSRMEEGDAYALEREEQKILLHPSARQKAAAFLQAHGYFLQQIMQKYVDIPCWQAAYEHGLDQGMSETEAVQYADSIIDATMGGNTAESISAFEVGTPLFRSLTMFYSYFNMQLNLLYTETALAWKGHHYGRMMWAFATIIWLPQIISDLVSKAVGSGVGQGIMPAGDDDDDDPPDWTIPGVLRYLAGQGMTGASNLLPAGSTFVKPLVNAVSGQKDDGFGGQRISASPVFSMGEAAIRLVSKDIPRVSDGQGYRTAVRDGLKVLSLLTGLPLDQPIGRPAGYFADRMEGKGADDDAIDTVRGVLSGKSPNR